MSWIRYCLFVILTFTVIVSVNCNEEIQEIVGEKNETEVALSEVRTEENAETEEEFDADFTEGNSTDSGSGVTNATVQVSCIQNKSLGGEVVEIVDTARLSTVLKIDQNITSRLEPGKCVMVFFYSASCPFSCLAAPHYNALPRYFPDIKMVAIDVIIHRAFNTHHGIFGIPTWILFHNGKPAARLIGTSNYSLQAFAKFIGMNTKLKPVDKKMAITSDDLSGPISMKPVSETDYYLVLSWTIIALRLLYAFYCSSWCRWLVDASLNAWREAEAQHHHID